MIYKGTGSERLLDQSKVTANYDRFGTGSQGYFIMPHSAFQKTGITNVLALSPAFISYHHLAPEDVSLSVESVTVISIPAFPASLVPQDWHVANFWQ